MSDLGQMIMTGISGTVLSPKEENFLEIENIGGVILFSHNYESPAQLAELVNHIQRCRREYPLFIAVDQEGGRVCRFKKGFTQIPSMQDVGRSNSPKLAFHLAKIVAEELAACGINTNFAPVCDILIRPENKVIGDRSFGADEEVVSKFVSSFIRGFQTHNILACAKHFPGHGSTLKDSHYDLPVVKRTMAELEQDEFKTFSKAIKSRVEFVMMAHLIVDAIDESLPTSLSPKAYSILRDDLRYTGLIITDDMEMKAIADRYSTAQAAVMAIKAGADIVEYRSFEESVTALDGLKAAKKTKELKNDLIAQKVERISRCKKSNLADYEPIYIPEIGKKLNTGASQALIKEIQDRLSQSS
jgi:beta-N-acetylhexosaminidase